MFIELREDESKNGQAVIGYLWIMRSKYSKETIASLEFYVEDEVVITDVHVQSEFQGQGYGRLMMEIMKEYSHHINKSIFLYSYPHVIKFYKKCGFKIEKKPSKEKREKDEYSIGCEPMVWSPTS